MSSTKSFLFYDLETSGLNPAFDQVIQFAAIRTDLQLNEIARYAWTIRPNPDTIPSPTAMTIHRTALATWLQGEPELIVMQRIHALFNTPGTMTLGYNTLGFDDEFLRFSFYRNLLAPYTHQFSNDCQRADLYPITVLYYLFHRDLLRWPLHQEKISLKLEAINRLNQLTSGVAHTAMVDVAATVALAKNFMQQPATWDYALGYFDKVIDSARIEKLPQFLAKKQGLLLQGILGAASNFCAPILHLGAHYHFKNQVCWLRLDSENLSQATQVDFKPHTWVINKKLAEPGFILPPTEKYLAQLTHEKKVLLEKNRIWLAKNPDILAVIAHYYCDYTYPKYADIAPEAALYIQGFWNAEQQQQSQQFHRAADSKKFRVIDRITHPLLKILAIHSLGRFDPALLSTAQREVLEKDWARLRSHPQHIIDYRGQQKLSLAQALTEIHTLQQSQSLDAEQIGLLRDLAGWLQER